MFMIFWNNGDYCWPMGKDPDCDGAVHVDESEPVIFASRKDAEKAIRISKANAQLRKAQGLPVNTDFIDDLHCVKIVRVKPYQFPIP
jgi:hypothetical protein